MLMDGEQVGGGRDGAVVGPGVAKTITEFIWGKMPTTIGPSGGMQRRKKLT